MRERPRGNLRAIGRFFGVGVLLALAMSCVAAIDPVAAILVVAAVGGIAIFALAPAWLLATTHHKSRCEDLVPWVEQYHAEQGSPFSWHVYDSEASEWTYISD